MDVLSWSKNKKAKNGVYFFLSFDLILNQERNIYSVLEGFRNRTHLRVPEAKLRLGQKKIWNYSVLFLLLFFLFCLRSLFMFPSKFEMVRKTEFTDAQINGDFIHHIQILSPFDVLILFPISLQQLWNKSKVAFDLKLQKRRKTREESNAFIWNSMTKIAANVWAEHWFAFLFWWFKVKCSGRKALANR